MIRLGSTGGVSALFISACLLVVMHASALAQQAERQIYQLGTSTTDGVSHPLGVTLAALVKLKLLPQANIDIDAKNTPGSRSNALSLRDQNLDFAILSNLDAFLASRGDGLFEDQGADETLRLVTNLWTSGYYFVVASDKAPTGTFADFLGLTGRPVALGAEGSSLRDHAGDLLDIFDAGLDDYQLLDLGGVNAAKAFLDGDVDGFLLVDERQGADLLAFLEDAGDRAAILAFDDDQLEAVEDDGAPAWTRVTIPVGALPQDAPNRTTVGVHNLLAASESVPDDAVYQITQTMFDNLPFLQEMHSATVGINLETALDRLLVPVHAGAARYYNEVGITVPEPEPVRISTLSQAAFLTRFGSIQEARTRLNEGTVSLLGGEAGQTLARMTSELAAELAGSGLRVVGMTTPDSAENIADVLYARGVDSAMVPLDILAYALEQNVYPDLRGKIAYITELFPQEVHLLASDTIEEIDDLIDRRVNLGTRGSASAFTVSFLLDELDIPVEPTYFDQRTALDMLRKGELAALFTVSGKPMPLLAEIPANSGLRLLPVPPLEGDAYRPTTLATADYPQLLTSDDPIETFAVRSALVSYNWRADNPRFQVLESFIDAFFDRLPALQEQGTGHHPKWRDVDPVGEIADWRRSPAAQSWLERQDGQAPEENPSADG